jgi:hypothetical protein
VLMTKFDILGKSECLVSQTGTSDFAVMTWSIFLNECQIYIFHKLDHTDMFFRLCICFSDNLVEFHSRNKEVPQMTRI